MSEQVMATPEPRLQLKNVQHEFSVAVGEIGVTIRRGFKWAQVPVGAVVDLVFQSSPDDVLGESRGTAKVTGVWVGRLLDLPARIIEKEHEPSSRTYSELVSSLKRGYGDFNEAEYFTALFYKRLTA